MSDTLANISHGAGGSVLILCPGGLEHGGGIGRQMGYFLRECLSHSPALTYEVVDTRGPWFLGASRRHSFAAALYLLLAIAKIVAARFSGRPAIAHVNITGRGSTVRKVILLIVVRLVGLRYLLHVHDPEYAADFEQRSGLMRKMVTATFRHADLVLVLGQRDKDLLERVLELTPSRTIVLHNAVPDPGPRSSTRAGKTRCHLLFLGYLSARKGVPELLLALATDELRAVDWRLTLAGGGPVNEFRRLSDNLGISDRVTCPGWLDEPAARSACEDADILVLPSHAEGLAMAVLEGMAHGLAIVTTPVGAHCEAVDHSISGILVPPGDIGALAAAILRLISDEDLRVRLQHAARERYLEKFDVGPYAIRLSAMHSALLSGTTTTLKEMGSATVKRA